MDRLVGQITVVTDISLTYKNALINAVPVEVDVLRVRCCRRAGAEDSRDESGQHGGGIGRADIRDSGSGGRGSVSGAGVGHGLFEGV